MARVVYRISLRQLRDNFAAIRKAAGDCALMPVLKYDAYGLGALKIDVTLWDHEGSTSDEAGRSV